MFENRIILGIKNGTRKIRIPLNHAICKKTYSTAIR